MRGLSVGLGFNPNAGAPSPVVLSELWANQTKWTQDNSGNRASIVDIAGYVAAVRGTTSLNTAERWTGSLPAICTIDFVVNQTAAWIDEITDAVKILLWDDGTTRTTGLSAAIANEDGYLVTITAIAAQVEEQNDGAHSSRADQAITLAEGLTTFRIRANKTAGTIKVYQGTTLVCDVTDASMPAGLGTGFLVGHGCVNTAGEKVHLGTVTVSTGDLGAPA